ncbi:dTDP-4-amino-4,6-dideoxygalactose transaminase [Rhizobium tibeticum]|uniref:UDP-2-acetamido-2-deoxy-3-oxo-D-glucuronateaminotransferase n=1 Tax=Rhizobium tibeticum TaxID=501024 RepID=A0A1H8WN22_9HYPH|nr:DegT/DnrJ/EryC1/StrS family aminotransferase [Rhizobium tibeticum]SEI21383.1 UDP-2-acetamido-2-deoxy-3-oxo-D-glucuronateaminotransferase [Rhizobium tibeticum]SEP29051.1 dTDP-4-amino-4,6-dideoxygalactose transaminase [Rhizobium tibeticum]
MNVSFFNYARTAALLPNALPDLLLIHCEKGEFILKSSVDFFERQVASFAGSEDLKTVAVGSASAGMQIALEALGIGPGDEVIAPAYSYSSTANSIVAAGATPIFVDIQANDWSIDVDAVVAAQSIRTKAVIAVHLYSGVCDIPLLRSRLPDHIHILEDSATSFGGKLRGHPLGTLGDIGVYSFYPAKPLGGLGDGGMIVTDREEVASLCRMRRNHGQDGKTRFVHHVSGHNSRMDEVNAAYLAIQMGFLVERIERRRAIAKRYDAAFTVAGVGLQHCNEPERVPYRYVVRHPDASCLRQFLFDLKIETQTGFQAPLPHQPAFAHFVEKGASLPVALQMSQQAVCLPLYPELTDAEVNHVINGVLEFGNACR